MYSPNTCFLESHPGPKRLKSHPGPKRLESHLGPKKLSVSLLMEVQINIEMYFSRSPPQAQIFFGGGGAFFESLLPVPLLHLLYSVFGVKITENYDFLSKMSTSKGGVLLSPNLKSENPFLKRRGLLKGGFIKQ